MGRVRVHIIGARNLVAADLNGTTHSILHFFFEGVRFESMFFFTHTQGYSDPYARISIVADTNKDKERKTTTIKKNCKHPPPQYYNESIGLNFVQQQAVFFLNTYNKPNSSITHGMTSLSWTFAIPTSNSCLFV